MDHLDILAIGFFHFLLEIIDNIAIKCIWVILLVMKTVKISDKVFDNRGIKCIPFCAELESDRNSIYIHFFPFVHRIHQSDKFIILILDQFIKIKEEGVEDMDSVFCKHIGIFYRFFHVFLAFDYSAWIVDNVFFEIVDRTMHGVLVSIEIIELDVTDHIFRQFGYIDDRVGINE